MDPLTSTPHRRYPVEAAEDVGVLRRAMTAVSARLPGLPEGEAELIATELATNILRHTAGGYVLSRPVDGGVELIAVDRGPGLPVGALVPLTAPPHGPREGLREGPREDPRQCGPGLGVGLATVRRHASTFDLCSTDRGTVVLARLGPARPAAGPWRWGAVNVPLGGAGESGDAWTIAAGRCLTAVVVDGLGHGPEAAAAAHAAITAFDERPPDDCADHYLSDFVRRAHEAMLGTRGGVLGACVIDPNEQRMTFTGVGNVSGRIIAAGPHRHLQSQHGTLGTGLRAPRYHQTTYSWDRGSTLVLTSDGIETRWDVDSYRRLLDQHPTVVAATVHRDHARGNDDATVLVVHDASGPDSSEVTR